MMPHHVMPQADGSNDPPALMTTQWTTLFVPLQARTAEAGRALEELCRIYRPVVLDYVQTLVGDRHAAEDYTQMFFADLLGKERAGHSCVFTSADRTRGRFRAYLRTCVRRFAANQLRRQNGAANGPNRSTVSVSEEEYRLGGEPPDAQFDRQWVQVTLAQALQVLRAEWVAGGQARLFDALEPFLWEKKESSADTSRRASLAEEHGMTMNALNLRLYRMRERLNSLVRGIIARTLADPRETDDEMRALKAAASRMPGVYELHPDRVHGEES